MWDNEQLDKEFSRIGARLGTLETDIKNKVSWKHFTWIISTVIGIQILIMGGIWAQVRYNGESINNTGQKVSNIEGILEGAEIISE